MHGHHPDEPTFCVLMAKGSRLGAGSHVQVGLDEGSVGHSFQTQKKNIINELMAKFDEEHSESVLAASLESVGAAKIIHCPEGVGEKERSASRVSTTGVVAKGTAEAEPAFEVDDVVGALQLYQTFLKDEVAVCDDDRGMNSIVILKKVLINELTLALSCGHGINLDKVHVTLTKDKADNTCIEDIFQNTNSTDATRFYLWEASGLLQRGCQFESPVGDPSRIF